MNRSESACLSPASSVTSQRKHASQLTPPIKLSGKSEKESIHEYLSTEEICNVDDCRLSGG